MRKHLVPLFYDDCCLCAKLANKKLTVVHPQGLPLIYLFR